MSQKEQVKSAFLAVAAIAEAIREAGRIPSGTLYAVLMGKMDIAAYGKVIGILKGANLIEERSNELIWIGPALETK